MKGFRGVEIKTAGPFLTAVDTTKYPDYLTIVSEPMDFAKIERKLKSDRYGSVDEFSADVHLIFPTVTSTIVIQSKVLTFARWPPICETISWSSVTKSLALWMVW